MESFNKWVEIFTQGALIELALVDEHAILAAWGFTWDGVVGLWRKIFHHGRGSVDGEGRM